MSKVLLPGSTSKRSFERVPYSAGIAWPESPPCTLTVFGPRGAPNRPPGLRIRYCPV